ncbi:Nucleoside-diphosphate-sugar epimerase [Desulfatibacillum alkenivorans DSM 16219]|jgi:nucleoside-diphosphate-sugar epimerase|uniref:Nucleoside-diphosphate-sugar epimerase n=1 Tax=Desulfatibacillum alkenivorans DSM 16219 TaxID=1121393 RepID=A0A1M6MNB1_9BACT|nr:NAD-dependent epimerase/dehydratase family protein [Desulfatibacillum alkenivorans]SHJ84968.1 Nucleoside-diphosphate-sugar epimerase [Desulfatibacillum alkenivorans DSM 16219]
MKALVTGATGFMGAKLCKALAGQGDEIRALIFPGEDYSHIAQWISEIRTGDITDISTLRGAADGVDVVYHLAARVVDYGTREDFFGPILDGTRNMLEVSADKAGRFVYISSICACGTGKHLKGRKESDPCQKTGVFYGDAKMEAEVLVKGFESRFSGGAVIVRPSNVIGPRSVWVAEVGSIIQGGGFAYFDRGRHGAGLLFIDNLVDGILLCGSEKKAAGQTYFFCDDYNLLWRRYLDDLAAMVGGKIRMNIPFGLAWLLGSIFEKIALATKTRPFITRHAVGLMGRDCEVDTSKAKAELGWKTRASYADATQEIHTWVKENMQ